METYAVVLIDRNESGAVEAITWLSQPDLPLEYARELLQFHRAGAEIYPTIRGFNLWNVDLAKGPVTA